MNGSRRPRFPFVGALLCAACLAAAAWTWMMYSYCWNVSLKDVANDPIVLLKRQLGRYERVEGVCLGRWSRANCGGLLVADHVDPTVAYEIVIKGEGMPAVATGDRLVFTGRMDPFVTVDDPLCGTMDISGSRFTGASIAGLVVGAMGVFVFAVALRHWFEERRRFREEPMA
jgi:hypothetical protein